ncbi:PIN domain-containing protein [Bacillus tropicus]|uniref:PIN domain-containing protein n=1 Tax=Bacillus tropicus TaxID=2026188 RepID=UPI003D221041
MNIFLDSNVLYKDPFLIKGFNRTLGRLARHEDVKLYISKVVYSEVIRGHKSFIEEEIKVANSSFKKISPYLDTERDDFVLDIKLEDLLQDFEERYTNFQNEEKLEIIDFDADVLEHIVEIDMYEKQPFIKKQQFENKGGDIVRYSKKEIRDAIIWYSYQIFIKKNNLENCYFISNNTNEFGDTGARATPEVQPYPLHPVLIGDTNVPAYKTTKGFIIHNDEQIKALFRDTNALILSEELYDKVQEELREGLAEELVNQFFEEQISSYTSDIFWDKQPEDIHDDYFMGGYVSPTTDCIITEVSLNEVEIYGDEITISVDVNLEYDVEIYLYNPAYDDKDEKYQYYNTDTLTVTENLTFVIPVDTETNIDEENFSFKDFIEGIQPSNLNIELIDWSNDGHDDMFPDEPDYE